MRRALASAILATGWLSLLGIGAQASSPLGPAPVVQSISPWVVAPGDLITISGQSLGDDVLGCTSLLGVSPAVHFVGLDNSGDHVVLVKDPANCNNTTLRVAVPTGFGGGARVFTQDPRGQSSNSNLQVTIKPSGTVTPASGTAGTGAAIAGSNLKPPTIAPNPVVQVFVGGAQQAVSAWSASSIAFSPRNSGVVQSGFLVSTDAADAANPAKLASVSVSAGSYTYVAPPPPSPSPPGVGPSPSPTAPGAVNSPPVSGTPGIVPGGPGPLPLGTFAGDFPNLSDPTLGANSRAIPNPAALVDSNHQFHKPAKAPSPVQLSLVANPHHTNAGGIADLIVTLTLNGSPIMGAPVRLRMLLSPGSDYAITPAAGVTDATGVLRARVRISKVNGDSVVQAESGLFSDQDHVQGTGGDAPMSILSRVSPGGIVPLVALGMLALAMLAIGLWINLRSVRAAAG